MKGALLIFALIALVACDDEARNRQSLRDAQARSPFGPVQRWNLDAAVPAAEVQAIRDRAYAFCQRKLQGANADCEREQDLSLFAYANSFRLMRIFRIEANPTFPFAEAHKNDPAAFQRVTRYCEAVYHDQGGSDARSLGPCMSAGVGGDFFGLIDVD
ncbi:hypothetical protein ACX0GZ_09055 [Sphingomonas aestuarii]